MEDRFLKLTNAVYKVLEFFPESDPLKNRAKDKALAIMDSLVLVNETSGWASFQKEKIKVQISEDVDILLGYLWIGKSQGWLNSVNYLIISNEYEEVKKIATPVLPDKSSRGYFDGPVIIPAERDLVGDLTQKLSDIEIIENNEKKIEELSIEKKIETKQAIAPSQKAQKASMRTLSARQSQIIEFLNRNEKAQVMDLQTVLPDVTKRTIRRDLDELLGLGKIVRHGDFNQVFYKINGGRVLAS